MYKYNIVELEKYLRLSFMESTNYKFKLLVFIYIEQSLSESISIFRISDIPMLHHRYRMPVSWQAILDVGRYPSLSMFEY